MAFYHSTVSEFIGGRPLSASAKQMVAAKFIEIQEEYNKDCNALNRIPTDSPTMPVTEDELTPEMRELLEQYRTARDMELLYSKRAMEHDAALRAAGIITSHSGKAYREATQAEREATRRTYQNARDNATNKAKARFEKLYAFMKACALVQVTAVRTKLPEALVATYDEV